MPIKRRKRDDGDDGDDRDDEWICLYCEDEIKQFEPFAMVGLRVGPKHTDTDMAPAHESCKLDVIAGQVAGHVLDSMEDQEQSVRLKVKGVDDDDLRGQLLELGRRWLGI